MHHKLVSEIMSSPVITIGPEALAADAAGLMERNGIRRVIVTDKEGHVCGIVTDADVLEAKTAESVVSPYDPGFDEEWLSVRDVMTAEVITTGPDAPLGLLVEKFMQTKISGIPVVEAAGPRGERLRPIGIVTETDIFRLISEAWHADPAPSDTAGTGQ